MMSGADMLRSLIGDYSFHKLPKRELKEIEKLLESEPEKIIQNMIDMYGYQEFIKIVKKGALKKAIDDELISSLLSITRLRRD